ncbi:hypothetical protein [Achromobacter sp. 413638]|uniref:hypothetical protein n=1 Tax=Achromobacter sp. 413638 TaxID=3342385 RepID=UPI00324C7672
MTKNNDFKTLHIYSTSSCIPFEALRVNSPIAGIGGVAVAMTASGRGARDRKKRPGRLAEA